MKIFNVSKDITIAANAILADSFFSRMKGLLGKTSLDVDEALVITKCNSIHMFFMRFAIDVIFLDKKNQVVGLVKNIRPFQMSRIFWKATTAVELPAGSILKTQTAIGDEYRFEE